jgi:hypothetical protein
MNKKKEAWSQEFKGTLGANTYTHKIKYIKQNISEKERRETFDIFQISFNISLS